MIIISPLSEIHFTLSINLQAKYLFWQNQSFLREKTDWFCFEKILGMNCIETNGLSYRFTSDQLILDKINFQVPSSSIHRFFGPGILCNAHKSYIVVIDKIDSIEKNEIRIGDKLIDISDTYRQAFYEILRSKD